MGYLDIIRQVEAERKRQENEQEPPQQIAPMWHVTWLGNDGKLQGPAQVDVIHTDEDGSIWVYVSWSGFQSAVNAKFITPTF